MECNKRIKSIGHSGRKSRKNGKVPGVIYGKGIENMLFEISELELNEEILQNGGHGFVNINLEGENHKALIKEIQRDPLTRKLVHIDLEKISGDKKITSYVPLNFTGEESVGKAGAVLQKEKNAVRVECTPDNLPKSINIDITNGSVGSVFRLSDVEVGEEISIIDDLNTVVAAISYERNTVSMDMAINEEQIKESKEDKKKD
jgi:large subunit ribosomal protein L25